MRRIRFVMSLTALLVLTALPASARAQVATTIDFDVSDSGYINLPGTLPAGRVTLVMRNVGQVAHHAKLVELKEGVSFDDYASAVLQGQATGAMITTFGGNGVIDPGVGGDAVTFDLQPGDYVVLDVLRAPDGQSNAAHGLLQEVQVVDAPGPPTVASVALSNFSIDGLPSNLTAGLNTLRIDNNGPAAHELQVVRLAPGKTADDFAAYMSTTSATGPQPYQWVGGIQSADPGYGEWSTLDLTPGNYLLFCNLADAQGHRHWELGMLQEVSVH